MPDAPRTSDLASSSAGQEPLESGTLRGVPQLAEGELSTHVRKGVAWTALSRVGVQLLQFASTIVLARLLTPTDYGVATVALVLTGLAAIFVDFGIPSAVIQTRQLTDRLLTTAFWANAGMGVAVAGLVALSAWPLAAAVDDTRVAPLVLLSSLGFLLSVNAIHVALMQRAMQFRRISRMTIFTTLAGVVASIVAAVAGLGAASLVIGPIVQQLVSVIQVWAAVRWVPRGRPDRESFRQLWAFGGGLTGFNTVQYLSTSADRLLLARFVDVAALGHYNRATNLMMLPVSQSTNVLSRVFFPALASIADDLPRLKRAWLKLLRAACVVGLPAAAGFAATAPSLVEVLYGPRWAEAAPILAVVSFTIPFLLLSANVRSLYQALGMTGLQFRLGLVTAALSVVVVVVGVQWGVMGVAVALVVRSAVSLAVFVIPLARRIAMGAADVWSAVWRAGSASALLGGAAWAAGQAMHGQWPAAVLAVQVLTGVVVYGALIWWLERGLLREFVKGRRKPRKAGVGA